MSVKKNLTVRATDGETSPCPPGHGDKDDSSSDGQWHRVGGEGDYPVSDVRVSLLHDGRAIALAGRPARVGLENGSTDEKVIVWL